MTGPRTRKDFYNVLAWSYHINKELYDRMRAEEPGFDATFQEIVSWGNEEARA